MKREVVQVDVVKQNYKEDESRRRKGSVDITPLTKLGELRLNIIYLSVTK